MQNQHGPNIPGNRFPNQFIQVNFNFFVLGSVLEQKQYELFPPPPLKIQLIQKSCLAINGMCPGFSQVTTNYIYEVKLLIPKLKN